jgi:Bacterial sugar transferase
VRLDRKGPVLFRQRRYGFNHELIEIYNFRSMFVDLSDADAPRLARAILVSLALALHPNDIDRMNCPTFQYLIWAAFPVGPCPHATQAKAQELSMRRSPMAILPVTG